MRNSAVPRKELLAKKHEQALIRRIAIISFFCLLIVLLLALYAIPAMVKIADVWDTTRNSGVATNNSQNNAIPLQTPFFESVPFEATNSAGFVLKGQAVSGSTVHLKVNGSEKDKVVADSSGGFTFSNLTLDEGTNTFVVFADNSEGAKSADSATLSIQYDTRAPRLDVTNPVYGETFSGSKQNVIEVKGKTDEATEMYVNEGRVILNADGSFVHRIQLQPGENTIIIYAKDGAGNKSVETVRKVTYNP